MATTEEYLDSIIFQVNYLRILAQKNKIPGNISDVVHTAVKSMDNDIDTLNDCVNDAMVAENV